MIETLPALLDVVLIGSGGEETDALSRMLADTAAGVHLTEFTALPEAQAWLAEHPTDVVLLEQSGSSVQDLSFLFSDVDPLPVVVVGSSHSEQAMLEALSAGAQDYLCLEQLILEHLLRVLRHAIVRRRAETVAQESLTRDISFLSESAIAFLELPLDDDIFRFIATRLQQLVGNAVISVTSYERQSDVFRVRHILGLGHTLGSIIALLGRSPIGMSFTPDEASRAGIASGKIGRLTGLYELFFGRISRDVCEMLERIMNIGEVYAVGFSSTEDLLGTAVVLLPKGATLTNRHAVETFVSVSSIALQRWQAESSLREQTLRDELTGLYNRRGFFAMAEHQLKVAARRKLELAVLYMDLDGLKQINDTFGHNMGDEALIEVGALLRDTFRASDVVARLGGDEFAMLVPDCKTRDVSRIIARLQERISRANASGHATYQLALSVGITSYTPPGDGSIDRLLSEADAAMYTHKKSRRK